jgi:hypothetical protein
MTMRVFSLSGVQARYRADHIVIASSEATEEKSILRHSGACRRREPGMTVLEP